MTAPTKLTDDVSEKITLVVRHGGSVEAGAAAAGVTQRTVRSWMARGQRSGAREAPYRAFRDAVERAQAEQEADLVASVNRGARRSWRAAAWLLERRYPERWGPPSTRPRPEPQPAAPDALDALDELAARRGRAARPTT